MADLLSEEDCGLMFQLYLVLQDVQISLWWDDHFHWWRNICGFSISSSYCRMLPVESDGAVLEAEKLRLLEYLWKIKAPSKVLIFGWRMILCRLSLRVELPKCHIIVGNHNMVCPLCFFEVESLDHIFFHCFV